MSFALGSIRAVCLRNAYREAGLTEQQHRKHCLRGVSKDSAKGRHPNTLVRNPSNFPYKCPFVSAHDGNIPQLETKYHISSQL